MMSDVIKNKKPKMKSKSKNDLVVNRRNLSLPKIKSQKNFKDFAQEIREIISNARKLTVKSVNAFQVVSNFLVGQRIVEFEQGGKDRAAYGKEVQKKLSEELTQEFGKGYSHRNLDLMRQFYLVYRDSINISQTLSAKLPKSQTPSGKSIELAKNKNTEHSLQISQTVSAKFTLSWSHYVFLMAIHNKQERAFYEMEASNENWSIKDLKRQFDSSLYERLALSRDKKAIKKLSEKGLMVTKPEDLIKLKRTWHAETRRTRRREEMQLCNQVETPNLGVSTALLSLSSLNKRPQTHFAPTTHHQKNKYRNESA